MSTIFFLHSCSCCLFCKHQRATSREFSTRNSSSTAKSISRNWRNIYRSNGYSTWRWLSNAVQWLFILKGEVAYHQFCGRNLISKNNRTERFHMHFKDMVYTSNPKTRGSYSARGSSNRNILYFKRQGELLQRVKNQAKIVSKFSSFIWQGIGGIRRTSWKQCQALLSYNYIFI